MMDIIETWLNSQVGVIANHIHDAIGQLEKILVSGDDSRKMRQDVLTVYNSLKEMQKQFEVDQANNVKKLANEVEVKIKEVKKDAAVEAMNNLVIQLTGESGTALSHQPSFSAAAQTVSVSVAAAPVAGEGDLPWIDSQSCTSCDECITINKSIFAYDDNKHAFVKNPKGGPFRDIVKAAEKCPSTIIHTGDPLDPKEKDLAKWVKRAEKFH